MIAAIEGGRYAHVLVPIPFLLLYVSVVVSGGYGGKLTGTASGVLAAAYVVFAGMVEFGPHTLTGGAGQIVLGVLLYGGTGFLIGRIREHRDGLLRRIHHNEAVFEAEVLAQTDELRKSEQRSRTLTELAPDIISVLDADGIIRFESPSVKAILGYEPEELIGANALEMIHPDDLDAVKAAMGRVLETDGKSGAIEFRTRHKDGSWRHLDAIGLNKLADPVVGGLIINSRDVTDRKQAEAALRRSEANFRNILDNMQETFYRTDLEGEIIMASPSAETLLGYEADELIGMKLADLYANAEERAAFLTALESADGRLVAYESHLRHKNGEEIWVATNAQYYRDGEGNIAGVEGTARDVTERRNAEAALRESEARFRDFTASASDWFWEMDSELRFTYLSDPVEGYLGRPSDGSMGQTRKDLFAELIEESTPDEREAWRRHFADLEARRPFRNFVQRWTTPAGETRYCFNNGTPFFDEDGNFAGYRGTASDITEQMRANEAQLKSEERFRRLVETMQEAVGEASAEGIITYVNDRNCELFGLPREELLGLPITDFLDEENRQVLADQIELRKKGQQTPYEIMWTRRDGGTFWTLSSPLPLVGDDGEYLGSYVVMADITERKQAEEALRASEARLSGVLDIAPDAIITTDEKGIMRMFNQGARDTFGYREEEVLGRPIEMLIPERFRAGHSRQMVEFGASGDRSRRMSERAGISGLRKDGTMFDAEASVSRLDLGGETLYNVILRDISERKRIEQEILLAKELAEAASGAKSDFLANMSHELRTPLNAILGFSEVMMEESFGPLNNEKYKEYIADIHASGTLLLDLINDVLDLSRVEAGVIDLNEGAVDLNAALRTTLRIVRERAARKSLRIETNLDPSSPVIRGDERAIKQIVLNLLSNCTKFTGEGGAISVTSKVEANGEILLIVADNGIGIAAADIAKVLEPFGQVGGAHTREHEGTGLGLPFAKRLAEMHDAAFELASEPGVGTTVTVRFPPERVAEADN